jgi:hypothetical protein
MEVGDAGGQLAYASRLMRDMRANRKGRPCNELGLAAQCLSAACPHLRAPSAPRPRWAHHNTASEDRGGTKNAADYIPDNGICERFHKTVLNEFCHVVFRKKSYRSIDELQADLGKTPMQTFLDASR